MSNIDDYVYEELLPNANSLVETINQYIGDLTVQRISAVEIVTLVAALGAVALSAISIFVTYKESKKARLAEDDRNLVALNATIVGNARIAWIQDVRNATAELVTACHKYIWSKSEKHQESLEIVLEKKALFVLFFGPDESKLKDGKKPDLFCKLNNIGKNEEIVKFVDGFYEDIKKYHDNAKHIDSLRKDRRECWKCNDIYEYMGEVHEEFTPKCEKDEHGTLFAKDDCMKYDREYELEIAQCYAFSQKLHSELRDLSEIMRIYCKLEWTRASNFSDESNI